MRQTSGRAPSQPARSETRARLARARSSRACGARTGSEAPEAERVGRVEIARQRRPRRVPVEGRPRPRDEEAREEPGPAVALQVEDRGDGSPPERDRRPEDREPLRKAPLARLERVDAVDVAMRLEELLRPHVRHDVEAQGRETALERGEKRKRDGRVAEGVEPDDDEAAGLRAGSERLREDAVGRERRDGRTGRVAGTSAMLRPGG